jgi:hypothetical protein
MTKGPPGESKSKVANVEMRKAAAILESIRAVLDATGKSSTSYSIGVGKGGFADIRIEKIGKSPIEATASIQRNPTALGEPGWTFRFSGMSRSLDLPDVPGEEHIKNACVAVLEAVKSRQNQLP